MSQINPNICGCELDVESTKPEHIIPNGIGGKLKSREILCDKHNNELFELDQIIYTDEVNKRKFGNDINTSFQRRFSPRGFAAQEDEINEMKNSTKSSIVRTENKNVKFTKSFHAY